MNWERVADECNKKLEPEHVSKRTQSGRALSYIEGWWAIKEANRIFGHGSWSRETMDLIQIGEPYEAKNNYGKMLWHVSYRARVRITVDIGPTVYRDGCGFGSGIDADPGRAHESALKEAETDATKRALMTFGNPFGLALYDKTQADVGHNPDEGVVLEEVVLDEVVLVEPKGFDKVPVPQTGIAPNDFKREPGENSSAMGKRDLALLEPDMLKCGTETELNEWWKSHTDVILELNTELRWTFFKQMVMRGLDLCTSGTRLEAFWNKHDKALKVLKKADEKAGTHHFTHLEEHKVDRFAQLAKAEEYEIRPSTFTPLDAG